ncbi:MAG: DUF11 domain-containing protein, partial [Planctomycetes bacterium]|nr:DUF11 domain-containing protein [Planctomycetota bacterium]
MKRIIIRLSALAGFVVLGLIAIAHAQRETEESGGDAASVAPPVSVSLSPEENTEQPTTLSAEQAKLFSGFPKNDAPPPRQFEVQGEATQLGYTEQQSPRDTNDRFSKSTAVATDLKGQPDLDARFRNDDFAATIPAGSGPLRGAALAQVDGGYESVKPVRLNHDADPGNAEVGRDHDFSRPRYADVADTPADTVLAGGPTLPTGDATDRANVKSQPAGPLPVVKDARPLSNPPPSNDGRIEVPRNPNTFRPADAMSASVDNGTGVPGDKQLEGSQMPSLTVLKSAPGEVQVGKPASFEISVRNSGKTVIADVEIHDVVPKGTRLISTSPQAARGPAGELIWSIGALKAGEQVKVQVRLMPTAEGEIGSVATVVFRSEASARTTATQPRLSLQVSAPRKVMIGEGVTLKIRISNTGSGTATGVVMGQNVPAALKHPAGKQLEFEVGTLAPSEVREIELVLSAVQAGAVTNTLTVQADGNLSVETITKFEVVAPVLTVSIKGPKRRYLDRRATYTVSLSNPGTATAKGVELLTRLPTGLKFVKAN